MKKKFFKSLTKMLTSMVLMLWALPSVHGSYELYLRDPLGFWQDFSPERSKNLRLQNKWGFDRVLVRPKVLLALGFKPDFHRVDHVRCVADRGKLMVRFGKQVHGSECFGRNDRIPGFAGANRYQRAIPKSHRLDPDDLELFPEDLSEESYQEYYQEYHEEERRRQEVALRGKQPKSPGSPQSGASEPVKSVAAAVPKSVQVAPSRVPCEASQSPEPESVAENPPAVNSLVPHQNENEQSWWERMQQEYPGRCVVYSRTPPTVRGVVVDTSPYPDEHDGRLYVMCYGMKKMTRITESCHAPDNTPVKRSQFDDL